jgi:hypothetical protein
MALKKVAILLTLFIFGSIAWAWGDPVKSSYDAVNQLTTMKMDENNVVIQKKTEPARKPAESLKNSQVKFRDVNFLRTLKEMKRSQWVESLNRVIYSCEVSEDAWRNNFFSPRQVRETKSSSSDSGHSILTPHPDGNGYFGEGRVLTTLRLLQSKEETFKEIFMGFLFSFDLANGHMLLEINVASSSEKSSGFIIRFRPATGP